MKRKLVTLILIIFALGALSAPSDILLTKKAAQAQASGATLFISPASGNYTVNRSFTARVMVDSGGGVGINAAEGVIRFDPAFLQISSVSQAGSIFNLWTTDPTFSNTEGRVTFGGGAPRAYTGNAGAIFTVTFTSRKVGTTEVTYSSGIVLAADGRGTNVYAGASGAIYNISAAEPTPERPAQPTAEPVKGILPPLPEVSSPTHPDENAWYADNEPEFNWKLLADLTGVSYIIDNKPDTTPNNTSDGVTEMEKFENIPDGVNYFHIKYQNRVGWGQTAHRKFMVDVTPPVSFAITHDNEGDPTNPVPKLRFTTSDAASGLDHYTVGLNQEVIQATLAEMEKGYYQPLPLAPGEYLLWIAAFDKAQNSASSSVKFMVEPLKAPIITSIPKIMHRKEELIIQGTSFYPQVTVKLYISKSEKDTIEASVKTDDQGNWSYFHKGNLAKGNYEVWARIIDDRGAQSLNSVKHLLTVVSPSLIDSYGFYIILVLLLIIAGLVVYILYQRRKFEEEKRRIKNETTEVKDKLRKVFAALREEADELIEMADTKPGLSEAERRIKEKLEESLDISEEFIGKEIDDVDKEIK